MADRLFVAVLGHQRSGKSTTWNELFGSTVHTGKHPRQLEVHRSECVEVFLISGSNEEREQYAEDVLGNVQSRIVLCSVQYIDEGRKTFEYAFHNGFDVYVQWLNPGYEESIAYFDYLGFLNPLLFSGATISMRDASRNPKPRVREIREFIYGWAKTRSLIFECN